MCELYNSYRKSCNNNEVDSIQLCRTNFLNKNTKEMQDEAYTEERWMKTKLMVKNQIAMLLENDLLTGGNSRERMLSRIQAKLGISRERIILVIDNL
jgi:hypothetical protein